MVIKLRAAVEARVDENFVLIARTDALAVTGLDDTLRRCHAYAEAGADVCSSRPFALEEIERVVQKWMRRSSTTSSSTVSHPIARR